MWFSCGAVRPVAPSQGSARASTHAVAVVAGGASPPCAAAQCLCRGTCSAAPGDVAVGHTAVCPWLSGGLRLQAARRSRLGVTRSSARTSSGAPGRGGGGWVGRGGDEGKRLFWEGEGACRAFLRLLLLLLGQGFGSQACAWCLGGVLASPQRCVHACKLCAALHACMQPTMPPSAATHPLCLPYRAAGKLSLPLPPTWHNPLHLLHAPPTPSLHPRPLPLTCAAQVRRP